MLRTGLYLTVCLTILAGCGDGKAKLGKVTGTVSYKGSPISTGTIVFHPEEGRSASAEIVAGEITDVTTYEANDGVPIGKHKVTVTAAEKTGEGTTAIVKNAIPEKYGSLKTTDLEVEITSGENTVELDLK